MQNTISDLFNLLKPMSEQKKKPLLSLEGLIDEENFKKAKYLVRTKKADIFFQKLGLSPKIMEDRLYPQLTSKTKNSEIKSFIDSVNEDVLKETRQRAFKGFSKYAEEKIKALIAPNIFGLGDVKEAIALQLFSTEPIHILLIGDPGTGKTVFLRAAAQLHPISSFGLGSGTSGAGLGVTMKGKETTLGLLPRADGGLCAIDELNLMKREDYAYLYSAMEKGFISYDKANKSMKIKTNVRVLATANPKGDKFVGKMVETLKKQLPFESALLSRFHIVFLVRKPGVEGFLHITKKILKDEKDAPLKEDIEFIRDYISFAEEINVTFPKKLESAVVDFIEKIKKYEDEFIIEVTPRIVIGIMRLCKANARMHLRKEVTEADFVKVRNIVKESLFLRKK
ncbi:MAG: hypothetical protein KKF44_02230 [Nanoarchaeota archaeon]|nr:hypothetical protein [Nanoarchaeota archaeon]